MWQYLGLAALFCLLPMLAVAAPPADPQAQDKIDPQLADRVTVSGQANFWVRMAVQADLSAAYDMDWEERGWYVYRTLVETARQTQASVITSLEARGVTYEPFWINNTIYVQAGDWALIQDLAARADVASIKADGGVELPEPPPQPQGIQGFYDSWGLGWINAPDVWGLGIDGSGIVVASIDTGVQYGHPQLYDTYRGTVDGSHQYNWCDPADICAGDTPCDNNGHGTHTMGTLSGENDDPAGNANLIGVAPGSTWITCKGCERDACSNFALLECAEWILAPTAITSGNCGDPDAGDPTKRPHVVNNSWGDVYSDPWYQSSVQAWQAAGIFPAFSAGNLYACGSVGSPGDYQEAFASANIRSDGSIHPLYSSRGPSDFGWEPYCKPNIAAPGTSICSAVPVDGYTCGYTGTSMASPHSAGTVALLWQACPDLVGQIDLTFQTLQYSAGTSPADPCFGTYGCENMGCNCTYGYGYLDALAAVQTCIGGIEFGYLDGYVYDQESSAPIMGASVFVSPSVMEGESVQASTDPTGYYTMTLLPGTYSVRASKTGYLPEVITDVLVITDSVTSQDFYLEYVGAWTEVNFPHPRPVDYTRFDGAFDPHDNLFYFPGGRIGGTGHDRSIWTYDPLKDVWADTGCDMNHNASNYTAVYIEDDGTARGEALYVVGGYDIETEENIDVVQRFYPSEMGCVVEDVASDPFPGRIGDYIVGGGGVAVVEDKIYYFGGWQTYASPYFADKTWVFDPRAPAGSRWTEIAGATLDPGRSYINVAVQGGLIYAMGGIDSYVEFPLMTLVPTNAVEVLDPADPSGGWVALNPLPEATAEGRGFGFEADTLGVQQPAGKLYVVGGGDWPEVSANVYEYDVVGDSWNPTFPRLNVARRNHAGSYVTACTTDENDGLPGMWVFGGRTSSADDLPPFGPPEYFGFACEAPLPPEAAFVAAPLSGGTVTTETVMGCSPLMVQFTDVTSGTLLERQWDFGEEGATSAGWRPVYTYETSGTFTVTLTVTNASGSDLVTGTAVVSPTPSAAIAYAPTEIFTDTVVQFTDTSTGAIAGWLWDFGDGFQSSVQDPSHTFPTPGYFTVTLTVTGTLGCPSSTMQELRVFGTNRLYYLPTVYRND